MQRPLLGCLILAVSFMLAPPAQSLINDADTLYVGSGELFKTETVQSIIKNVSITIKSGGTLQVATWDGGLRTGKVLLAAPVVLIEGSINAVAVGHNEIGKGGAPSSTLYGAGGAGYGGTGGRGAGTIGGGAGGNTYGPDSLSDNTGSYGGIPANLTPPIPAGYGGGSVRIEAIALTLTSTAQIACSAYQTRTDMVGGGSGGTVYLYACSSTRLDSGSVLAVNGGQGGTTGSLGSYAGGGGGGRIKLIQSPNLLNSSTRIMNGGASGGGTALAGSIGVNALFPMVNPFTPTLSAPNEGAQVGAYPTLVFYSSDAMNTRFLKYKVEVSQNNAFPPASTIECNQVVYDPIKTPGWKGKSFFSSGEVASYEVQTALTTGTWYWRISVTNNEGATWTTSSYRTILVINALKPLAPLLVEPTDNTLNASKTPSFKMVCADANNIPGNLIACSLLIATDPGFSNAKIFQYTYSGWDPPGYYSVSGAYLGLTINCQILNSSPNLDALIPGLKYYWKVVATNIYQLSMDSPIFTLSTAPLPNIPTVYSPPDKSVVTTRTPTLQFASSAPGSNPLQYKVELSSDNFQTILTFQSSTMSSGWTPTSPPYASGATVGLTIPNAYALVSGVDYSWRAYAYDVTNDNWSLATVTQTFTLITPPRSIELISPSDNYSAPSSQITFQFKATSDSGNTLTGICAISDDNFASIKYYFSQTTTTQGWDRAYYQSNSTMAFTIPSSIQFDRGKKYYWRASAFDGISVGPYSDTRSFQLSQQISIQQLRVAPNPAVSVKQVQLLIVLSVDADTTVRFYNAVGREIDRVELHAQGGPQGNVITKDISEYASGLYFYTVEARSDFGTQKSSSKFAVVH